MATPESGRRRTHRKVRTGCITCKIRRVKCDEEKPACRRCRSTGRKCDGYASYPTSSAQLSLENIGMLDEKILLPMKVKAAIDPSPLEVRGLEYFQVNTIQALSCFVKTELWSTLLLQLSHSEPAIRHAMIAFSAYHELIASKGFDVVAKGATAGDDEFALKEYNVALGQLWRHMSSGNASKTVTLVSCLLFICLEFIRGNRENAIIHLKNGMSILRLAPSEAPPGTARELEWTTADEAIAPVFSRIALVQTVLGQPRESRYMDFLSLPQPEPLGFFLSIEDARCAMVNLVNAAHSFSYMTDTGIYGNEEAVFAAQSNILAELQGWLDAFEPYLDPEEQSDTRGACLLKATVVLCVLWTKRAHSHDECLFDLYTDDFRDIVDLIEHALAQTDSAEGAAARHTHTFSVDTGMISNLFFCAIKCRDRLLRRRAIACMYRCPRREGLWDAVEIAKLAELIVRVEEEALDPLPCADVPTRDARVADFDLRPRDEDSPQRQMVRLSRRRFTTLEFIDVMRVEYLLYDD